ncbi:AIPR family protein [Paraclostridium bifermentans]|uniref:AIPR family protein n=1 Tax=Paraclostridium bifermentans TaxID=1490 RepID=UPI001C102337|nr:AIPR family protein [Paraclostridium bifermentans]MBU5288299.1 AIPR family protein [Paraclostridium bifermentans]
MNNSLLLKDCLDEFINSNDLKEIKKSDAFEIFSMLQITKEYDTSYEEINDSIVDGSLDGGIDSFLILLNDKAINSADQLNDIKLTENSCVNVYIAQSKFENSFKEGVIDKIVISMPLILNLELSEDDLLVRFNPNLVEKILIFREIWRIAIRKKSTLSLSYIYACNSNDICINPAFKSKTDQLLDLTAQSMNIDSINFNPYSSKELLELYHKRPLDELELNFKENPTPVSFKKQEYGYIGIVGLNDYYNFIIDENSNIRESIFENNIRHYQGKVDVNNKISSTLTSDNENDFWWLNNGITIIASSCRPMLKTLILENPQIVNGLQTSYTIGKNYTINEQDKRSILVKIVVSDTRKTIDKIISASNSQNAVPSSLLRATDDIQRDLETYCLTKGYFYDRRKNYYKNKQKPANKIISIQNMAQSIEAILNFSPANARSKPTTLVKTDSSYKKIFNSNNTLSSFLNCAIICRRVSEFIKNSDISDKSSIRNFAYHISRILVSVILDKSSYNHLDVSNITEDMLTNEKITTAYEILTQTLELYMDNNPSENIINISKSNKFVNILNDTLNSMYNVQN